jgi:uncharacterized protein YsxB (DUF464 family)
VSPSPFAPGDADQILADFGEDLVCAAVPAVTRGLLDDVVLEGEVAGQRTVSQQVMLKVKRGAFAGVKVQGTTVTVTSWAQVFVIDAPLARPTSLFDHYVLQLRRP